MPLITDGFEFDDFLSRGCTIWPIQGRDSYGGYIFGAPFYTGDESIWFSEESQLFKNADGQELVAKAEIITKWSVANGNIKRGDYVILDRDATSEPDPIAAGAYEIDAVNQIAADALDSEDAYQIFAR